MCVLQTYVGGIQLLSAAGATWAIAPQVGDLTHVDSGFSTALGLFSSKWSLNGTAFRLEISTPQGTTGSIGIPLPGNHTTAFLSGVDSEAQRVSADESGRYWIHGVAGGEHEFVALVGE